MAPRRVVPCLNARVSTSYVFRWGMIPDDFLSPGRRLTCNPTPPPTTASIRVSEDVARIEPIESPKCEAKQEIGRLRIVLP